MDLFGDETEEEKKSAEEREAAKDTKKPRERTGKQKVIAFCYLIQKKQLQLLQLPSTIRYI